MTHRTETPFEINVYYVLSFCVIVGMLVWVMFRPDHFTIGDWVLWCLTVLIFAYARRVRDTYGEDDE